MKNQHLAPGRSRELGGEEKEISPMSRAAMASSSAKEAGLLCSWRMLNQFCQPRKPASHGEPSHGEQTNRLRTCPVPRRKVSLRCSQSPGPGQLLNQDSVSELEHALRLRSSKNGRLTPRVFDGRDHTGPLPCSGDEGRRACERSGWGDRLSWRLTAAPSTVRTVRRGRRRKSPSVYDRDGGTAARRKAADRV